MGPSWIAAVVVAVFLSLTPTLNAQVATGSYPYGSFDNNGFDTVNVGNLNVHLSVPVLNKAGRGLPFNYNLIYDSSVYYPVTTGGAIAWSQTQGAGWGVDSELTFGYLTHSSSSSTTTYGVPPHTTTCTIATYSNWAYVDPYGIKHAFPDETIRYTGNCTGGNTSAIGVATDGSGYTLSITGSTNGTIISPSGRQVVPATATSNVGTASDTNGNYISTDGSGHFTDTSGNVVLTVAGNAPSAHTFTYTDANGNPQSVSVTYHTYTVQTAFGCSGITEYGPLSSSLVDTIALADGSSYHFTYEATPGVPGNVTSRLAGVQLPQGGTIHYAYSGGSNGIVCADGSAAGLTRTLDTSSGSAASARTYTRTTGTGTSHTEVVDGLSNHLAYDFVIASNQPAVPTAAYFETNRSVYQGGESGTPVLARSTCYDAASAPCVTAPFTLPITQIDTYETLDGIQTHGSTAKYDTYGDLTEQDIYDFGGATSRGPLLSKEVWTYAGGGSIVGLVTEDDLYDGSSHAAGKTVYTYDGVSVTSSSGVPNHQSVTGTRGNLTTLTQYASAGTSYASTATYEDTGSPLSSTTPNGTSSASYNSTFLYQTQSTPPTPSSGISLPSTATYDTSHTGLVLTATDPNGAKASVASYDSLLRPTEVDSYNSASSMVGKTTVSYSPTQVGTHVYQSASVSSDQETQYDSYGRPSRTALANGQSANPWYQQDVCYNGNGNVQFSSYAYQGAGLSAGKVCSGPGDTYTYDVLGRVKSVARSNGESIAYTYLGRAMKTVDQNGVTKISQVDGLGRPAIVCEISSNSSMPSSGSPAGCGEDISGTGFATNYAYDFANHKTTVTQGAQTRIFQTDWLDRTLLVQEPESSQTNYSYAYNSTGLVVTRTKPKANQTNAAVLTTTTTQYDALGRVLSIAYTDGTPTKTFAYDASAGWTDLTQTYLKGRMSSAAVSNAETVYSYDPFGRTAGMDECLPSGCGTTDKQLLYSYDWAGNTLSSTDGAGVSTSYTPTIANELSLMTTSPSGATYPGTLISSVQNTVNGPGSYSLGNGLSSVYSYDGLGRLNGGWVCSGSASANCSGGTQTYGFSTSLWGQQLQASTDTVLGQSSSYGYDEFNRLSSLTVTAGAGNGYSWTYDRYGNRWAQTIQPSGSSLSVGFNVANNQINTGGFTYDAAGNLTWDGFHSYAYDAEGNLTAVDGGSTATYVYDALNHRVRTNVGGTAREFIFNAGGQRVSIWDGSTLAQVQGQYYWGSEPVAYYAGGATHFQHQDWLGTERVRTSYNGSVEGTFTSLPFGDSQTVTSGTDTDAYHFAGLDTDAESYSDHAQFRQLDTTWGHWRSPDPYLGSYDISDPQSMNRYAYVENAPLAFGDPSGLVNVHMPSGIYTGGGLTDAALEAQLQAQAQLAQFALDEFAVLEGYFASWGHYVTQMQQVGACNPDVPCDTKPVQVWVWNANAFDPLPFLLASNNQPQAPNNGPPLTPEQLHKQQQTKLNTRCAAASASSAALATNAGLNEVGAALTGEVSPFAAIFHGIALVEGIGAGGVGIYAAFACYNAAQF